ncbi:alpha/beta hydrolase [Ancylomarina sp. YFZ004]
MKGEFVYNDLVVPLITNRICDTLQNKSCILKNYVDDKNALMVYRSDECGASFQCQKINEIDQFSELLNCNNDWLVFVHGDGKTSMDAAARGLEIQNLYGVKIIVFSWPSRMEKGNGLSNFKNSQKNIEHSASRFKEMLLLIQELKQSRYFQGKMINVSLFMHSLGNYYLERVVKDSLLSGLNKDLFDNLIINAAAVNQKGHVKWVDHLNIQKRIYITSNKQDFNLNGLRVFTKARKQLGERLKLPLSENAEYVNFTKAIRFLFPPQSTHTYFRGRITNESENIKQIYFKLFHGEKINLNDTISFIQRRDGLGYDVLF